MYRVICPIYLPQSKKKSFALNLNIYRNAHFLLLNKMKVLFKERIQDQIIHLPTMSGVKLTYTLFMGTNREMDLSNVCVVVDKFFCDAIVEAGKLEDDNFKFLSAIDYRFGGIDPGNPRCEVTLEPQSIIKDETMRIFLVQSEIEEAIRNFIGEQVSVAEGMAIGIKFAATRGEDGYTAEIDISKPVEPVQEETPVRRTRGPRKAQTEQASEQASSETDGVTATDVALTEATEDSSPVTEKSQEPLPEAGIATATDEQAEVEPPAFIKEGRRSIFSNN